MRNRPKPLFEGTRWRAEERFDGRGEDAIYIDTWKRPPGMPIDGKHAGRIPDREENTGRPADYNEADWDEIHSLRRADHV